MNLSNLDRSPHDGDEQPKNDVGYAIQPAIWPESGISTEIAPYFRLDGPAGASLKNGGITFAPGGAVSVDGYFNLFNLGKWNSFCGNMPIELWLIGHGKFQVTVWLASENRSWDRIHSEVVELAGRVSVPLDLTEATQPRMLLFFDLVALESSRLDDFSWATTTPPRQTPSLAISVTTFKREEAVESTVQRFREFRKKSPLRDFMTMFIVDNGQSSTISSDDGIEVFPNVNLGGAGGFARGLLEAQARNDSHCLFMDDDASVHMGAITRTWMLLAYAIDERSAVAGAMINADHRWQIWENGAVFDRGCRPLYFGLDMRDRASVFNMEFQTSKPTPDGYYAGWWYFAFPIAYAHHFPFPFFVRGDDVSFSLSNDFKTITLPGVASFQESFTDKASPSTWYLDMRSHLAHHFSLPTKKIGWMKLQRMLLSFYLRTVLRYHYDSLSAVNLAIEDVISGPEFFAENADMAERRNDLKKLNRTENWAPLSAPLQIRHGRSGRKLRMLLLLSLNGHLLPFSNLLGTKLVVEAVHRDNFRAIYGAKQITYLNVSQTSSYTVTRDRTRFINESKRLLINSLRLLFSYKKINRMWESSYPELTSIEFWRKKLAK